MFFNIPHRTSDCAKHIIVDPVRGIAQVAYHNGNIYEYTHVSRRAIANLILNPNMSLGFWINENLLPYNCKTATFGKCTELDTFNAKALPELVMWSLLES